MRTIKHYLTEFRALKISLSFKFVIGVALTLAITMGTSFYFISKKHEQLIIKEKDTQAKALFRQIVLTRKWVADHGSVFVYAPWKKPSPYMKDSYIIDSGGKKYIRESPAMVTKDLSLYAQKEGTYWFHLTSLKLINPENAPDEFEKKSLIAFENGGPEEYSTIEKIGPSHYYRFIAPLYIEKPCLKCHAHQGYQIDDVRGAISVSVPMDDALSMISSERKNMIIATVATMGVLMLILYILLKELVLRPVTHIKTSMQNFSESGKTDVPPIRTGDELEDLSRSFVKMSASLREYHIDLEEKIMIATKNLEEANSRLVKLNEKKSDFIAEISHELRTPLTSIKGAMDYIQVKFSMYNRADQDKEDLAGFLDVIRKNADRLVRMVNDTLDLERIEFGMLDLHFSDVHMLPLIKEVILGLQSIAAEKDIAFAIKTSPDIYITADEDRIRQVLINLISNSIDFSPEHAEIQIVADKIDGSVRVTIHDEGPGIPVEVQEKIFDKYYTIGRRKGTGLGLAICKGIIEAHQGEIGVSCETADVSSSICFTIPVNKEEVH